MTNMMRKRVRHPGIWQPEQFEFVTGSVSSGNPILDSQLGGAGWSFEHIYQVSQAQSQRLFTLMLPAIYQMMRQKRWVVLISPPKAIVQQFRHLPEFDASRLLVVHSKDEFDTCWAMEGAIRSRNAACIFSWVADLDERDIKRLKLAARESDSLNLVIDQTEAESLLMHSYASESTQLALHELSSAASSAISCRFH